MSLDRKSVVWYEGMTLDPHHFQQWDRYHDDLVRRRSRFASAFDWGVSEMQIDRDRLTNGEFALKRASGVMPDGLIFDIPGSDPPPEPRNVQDHISASQERLKVYLAVATEQESGVNVRLQGSDLNKDTRYEATSVTVADRNTGQNERSIEVGQTNWRIRLEGESASGFTQMPIAEVQRSPSGGLILSERYIPPSINTAGSERLSTIVRGLVEVLSAKSTSLSSRYKNASTQREFTPSDILAVGLLTTVNTYLPVLVHRDVHGGHPESLYLELVALAGQTAGYLPQSGVNPRDFPVYEHGQPTSCFNTLDTVLRDLLGGAAPQANYAQLPLEKRNESLYVSVVDAKLLDRARLYLVARSDDLSEEVLVNELPHKLRIASPATIEAVLRSYINGLPVEHTHRLPSGMPVDHRANYFQLRKNGPFWEAITKEGEIAIFTSDYHSIRLQLIAVDEHKS